jgi:hypothetical protein
VFQRERRGAYGGEWGWRQGFGGVVGGYHGWHRAEAEAVDRAERWRR